MLSMLSLATGINAQNSSTDSREKLQIGAKAGVSYSNVFDAEGEVFNADAKIGFTGGAFLVVPIGKYLGIQPEVLITQKGFKGSGRLLGTSYNFSRTTTFLEIPLLLALKPSEYFTILAGPQFSYLINQRDDFSRSTSSIEQEQKFKLDNIRKNIFGMVGGIDINLNYVVLSGRVGWDIQRNIGNGTSDTPRYKNVCTQFTIGFII